jgi:ABC-type multidrug transport system fused ATPase/permease subunit
VDRVMGCRSQNVALIVSHHRLTNNAKTPITVFGKPSNMQDINDTFRVFKKTFKGAFSTHGVFLSVWYISAATVFILPLIVWGSARAANKSSNYYQYHQYQYNGGAYNNNYNNGGQYQQNQYDNYQGQNNGQYNYDEQQQQQQQEGGEEQQVEEYNNGQNQYNQGQQNNQGQYYGQNYNQNYYNQQGQYNQMQAYHKCKWYQWGCTNNYMYQQYPNRNEWDNYLPWWWMWAEDERRKGQQDGANPTLVVIYLWSLVLIAGLLLFGHKTLLAKGTMNAVAAPLMVFANFSFLSVLFLGGLKGAIEDDGWGVMKYGWYGQFGVLVYMTHFLSAIYGFAFYYVIRQIDAWKDTGRSDRVIVLDSRH